MRSMRGIPRDVDQSHHAIPAVGSVASIAIEANVVVQGQIANDTKGRFYDTEPFPGGCAPDADDR